MPRHLRIRHIVTTDQPGELCIHAICGSNPDGTHWTLRRDQAVSQIEDKVSAFYMEKSGGKRFDANIAFDRRANKCLKTIPDRDHSNELLFLPNCLRFTQTQNSRSFGAGAPLATFRIRVLVVDDYEPWRRFACSTLRREPELQIIGQASDGLEAVQQAQQLQPDFILLDIGLPTLNGIEAARRIREVSPVSKILFVSENRSRDLAHEALRTGASGYVVKSNAGSELLPALRAVLLGKQFVSASLTDQSLGYAR